jgi:hypothetical protein
MVFLDTVIFAQKGHYLEGGNPLLQIVFRITVCLRASTCSTRRKYVPVGLTPASMLATVVQAVTRMQTCLSTSLETEMEKVYG